MDYTGTVSFLDYYKFKHATPNCTNKTSLNNNLSNAHNLYILFKYETFKMETKSSMLM